MTLAAQLGKAARIVERVAQGASASPLLAAVPDPERPALLDLTHGTLRRYGRVQALVRLLSHRAPDPRLAALLWCALYALESPRYGEHTVVDEAVKATGLVEHWAAKGYVNALLRRYLRERAGLEERLAGDEVAAYQHPAWWIALLRESYPNAWQGALAAGNAHPPMTLRVNRRRGDVERYGECLARAGLRAQVLGAQALLLERPVAVSELPGFTEGEVSVQDLGAQRAAYCLDLRAGQRVLDACAAPGGKGAHMLELADVELTAVDVDPARAARIAPDLARLGLAARVLVGDAAEPERWWQGPPFERILADVPCSASGIARRRPDVKWLRRAGDQHAFAERQRTLLGALWRLLAPGGKLLYATCSVFPQENEAVVAAFLAEQRGAQRLPLPDGGAAQWLPEAEHDGFYYALIARQG